MSRPAPTAGRHLRLQLTQGIGRDWVLEANLEAQFYAKNDDYFGSDLEQKPLYRLQAFASYDFSQSTYGALAGARRWRRTEAAGPYLDDTHQRYTQLGFEQATGWTGATA